MKLRLHQLCVIAMSLAALMRSPASAAPDPPEWRMPNKPFQIVSGIYYVGSKGLASYLFVSNGNAILLDPTLADNARLVERNIETLGFNLHQIKMLINSHAHLDHAGGLAQLKRDTGAPVLASAGDRWALEHGDRDGENIYKNWAFPRVHVDKVLKDGDIVSVGAIHLRATLTPGHTKGCTTWATTIRERGRTLNVVSPCSISVAGNVLINDRTYPGIVADYRRSFKTLGAMKADIVLSNHPEIADVLGREARRKAGNADAFVDPALLKNIVAAAQTDFDAELAKQRAAASKTPR